MTNLSNLASKAEDASGDQQSELLEEAFRLIFPPPRKMYSNAVRLIKTQRASEWAHNFDLFADMLACGACLDAALTLVPEGADWRLTTLKYRKGIGATIWTIEPASTSRGDAATPALALCAAALRARDSQ